MIRQLGAEKLFCSFSSAETKWMNLLWILKKRLDNKNYSGGDWWIRESKLERKVQIASKW